MSLPETTPEQPFALDYDTLATAQQQQEGLIHLSQSDPEHFMMHRFTPETQPLLTYVGFPGAVPRIVLADVSVEILVNFYHVSFAHTVLAALDCINLWLNSSITQS